jgi:hypothetical protein
MSLLLSPECRPFLVALILVAALSVVQVLALAPGRGVWTPWTLTRMRTSMATPARSAGWAWASCRCRVWLIVFGVVFGGVGLLGQAALQEYRGATLPALLAGLAALAVSLPLVRVLSRALSP